MPAWNPGMAATGHTLPLAAPVNTTQPVDLSGDRSKQIRSPFVGTFYEAASPGAEAFVRAGSRVKKGDTLCIIEAMKIMNEIEADRDGTIKDVWFPMVNRWNLIRSFLRSSSFHRKRIF